MYQILQELRELLLENLRYERSKTICAHEYDRSIIGSKELELTCNPEINDYVHLYCNFLMFQGLVLGLFRQVRFGGGEERATKWEKGPFEGVE